MQQCGHQVMIMIISSIEIVFHMGQYDLPRSIWLLPGIEYLAAVNGCVMLQLDWGSSPFRVDQIAPRLCIQENGARTWNNKNVNAFKENVIKCVHTLEEEQKLPANPLKRASKWRQNISINKEMDLEQRVQLGLQHSSSQKLELMDYGSLPTCNLCAAEEFHDLSPPSIHSDALQLMCSTQPASSYREKAKE